MTLIRPGGCPGWFESSLGTQSFCWFYHWVARILLNFRLSQGLQHLLLILYISSVWSNNCLQEHNHQCFVAEFWRRSNSQQIRTPVLRQDRLLLWRFVCSDYHKIPWYSETQKIAVIILKNLNNLGLPYSNESKRCRGNGKQCRPRSDCSSSRSSVIWVCTVCPGLSVRKQDHYGIRIKSWETLWPGITQPSLLSYRHWLESWNFGFSKIWYYSS